MVSSKIKSYRSRTLSIYCRRIVSRLIMFTRVVSIPASSIFAGRKSTPSSWCRIPSSISQGSSLTTFSIRFTNVTSSSSGSPIPRHAVILPWASASIKRTLFPSLASPMPRFTQVVLFPTPPFCEAMVMTFAIFFPPSLVSL